MVQLWAQRLINAPTPQADMARKVGLGEQAAKTLAARAPRLLVIAGATGTGKSTASVQLAAESGFDRLLSTDAIREIMRACDPERTHSTLHRSSFSKGDSGEPVIDWLDTCQAVEGGIVATIDRARREGIDLLIEGVHINPSERLLRSWREAGGIAVGLVIVVSEEERHKGMLRSRDAHSFRRADRYLAAFPRIRAIQNGLTDRAKIASWPVVDVSMVKSDTERIKHLMDVAWNEHQKR
ncbi:MAG: putative 2-phosphoglycerate kinase [uncultured Candidatus Poseidoniales archaeon]|jgi:2-phosphoglycerate kinase|nr:MAG: putative 2-phosphoglycerate kinase [uncultured Candidatus Poseidoniales archaeon]